MATPRGRTRRTAPPSQPPQDWPSSSPAAPAPAAAAVAAVAATEGDSIDVIMVNNPQMEDLETLVGQFEEESGINVNLVVLPENDVRDSIQTDFAAQSGQYDVATISNYETPFFSKNGWIANLDDYVENDADFDQDDILQPIADGLRGEDGSLYAAAVLRRELVPDVPQGRLRGERPDDAGATRPGTRWRHWPRSSTAPSPA